MRHTDLHVNDLVRITPLYLEKSQEEEQLFWEIIPLSISKFGDISRYAVTSGQVGTRGQTIEFSLFDYPKFDYRIRLKMEEGYLRKERPTSRGPVQIGKSTSEDVGLVTRVVHEQFRSIATLLVSGETVMLPVDFLVVVASGERTS